MLTYEEKVFITAIIQSCSGFLSLVGSLAIINVILRSKEKLNTTQRRLIFGMSMTDAFSSAAYLLSTIPNTNVVACDIQGFFIHIGSIGTPFYNCSLCVYYVLTVCFGKDEKWTKTRVEPFLHAFPILFSIASGIFLSATQSFNVM